MADKRYVIKLGFKGWEDNLFLAGPEGSASELAIGQTLEWLEKAAPRVATSHEYRNQALEAFKARGFYPIAK